MIDSPIEKQWRETDPRPRGELLSEITRLRARIAEADRLLTATLFGHDVGFDIKDYLHRSDVRVDKLEAGAKVAVKPLEWRWLSDTKETREWARTSIGDIELRWNERGNNWFHCFEPMTFSGGVPPGATRAEARAAAEAHFKSFVEPILSALTTPPAPAGDVGEAVDALHFVKDDPAYSALRSTTRGFVEAALSRPDTGVSEWRSKETIPTEPGAKIRALVETKLTREEYIPALLVGGWKRTASHDEIVGWLPAAPEGGE